MIIRGERDIAKLQHIADRREVRNFQRFLRLYPIHGFDMLHRARWQKYLCISQDEAMGFVKRGYIFKPAETKGPQP